MDSVESAMGHVMLNLCFCIRWDMWVMQCILVHPGGGGAKHQLVVFLARVGPVRIPQKARRDTLH
jgi:hypothetical protein